MSNYINIDTVLRVRYLKKYTVPQPIRESANYIKGRLELDNVRDIQYVVENWQGISSNPDTALCKILNRIDSMDEQTQNRIIESLDNSLLPLVSETCLNNISNRNSLSENINFNLLDRLSKYRLYDRVDSNFNKLVNRLDLKRVIRESKFSKLNEDNKKQLLTDITNSIYEEYDISDVYKFNITLESLLYGFKTIGIPIDESMILQTVTEYYVDNTSIGIESIKNTISEIHLFSDEAKQSVLCVYEEKKSPISGIKKQTASIKELCKSFTLSDEKSIDKLKDIFKKIYIVGLDDCINESDSILRLITTAVITLGATAINPVFGILAAFTQYIVSREANIKQTEEYLENLKDEKKKVQKKIDNAKGDTKELEKYLEKLEISIEKVSDYKYKLQTDKENDRDDDNDDLDMDFDESMNMSAGLAYLSCVVEALENENVVELNVLSEAITNDKGVIDLSILNEANKLTNTVRLVKEKLKNAASKLSSKEKALCSQVDNRFDIFVRDFERAMSLEKREKVIKGKVVPSVTNMIKIAIAGTLGIIYAPTITAIGMLGAYAISKKATIKEKQFILDELQVQLKIVEKKISQAEMKGDDKALEDLYRLQARLDKEYKRIKYRIRLYHESGCVL